MESLVRELELSPSPWRSLLDDPRFATLRPFRRCFTDSQRSAFFRLLSPQRRRAFLELQAGTGVVSAYLAEDYEHGFILERRRACADFIRHRLAYDSVRNVEVLPPEADVLPLPDSSVDLVAVNEPISASGMAQAGGSREAQRTWLGEARRVLRAGGRLIVAMDNAWHWRHAAAAVASRVNLRRWEGSVPRSIRAYGACLKRAGFPRVRPFVIRPDRDVPIDIYSFHLPSLEAMYRRYDGRGISSRLVKRVSDLLGTPYLAAYLQPSYYIVGE